MDTAILSWHECLFSQRVEELLTDFLQNLELNGQKIDIKLQTYDLKQIEHHAVAAEVHRSKLQIVIISNHFIDRLRHEAKVRKKMSPINRVLRPKRVIAVLVQLTAEDIAEYHRSVLTRFHEWYVVEIKTVSKPNLDEDFCVKMSEQIMKIYNAELSSTSNFVIFPTKVTKDQPKIAILFKKPIESLGENIRFELSRGSQIQVMNDVRTTNPCTALIRVPDVLCTDRSGLIEITPYVNNHKMGTKLVKYEYHIKQIDEDVIERMTLALPGFHKLLDDHISQTLSKNFRLCEDFSLDPSLELLNDTMISREDDFPTAMHMACYYGLESTVWVLLEEGDGLEQCSMRNDMNETPLDIAQAKGYEASIGQMIKDYKEVNFTWKALQYVKDLYERQSGEGNELHENGVQEQNGISEKESITNDDEEAVEENASEVQDKNADSEQMQVTESDSSKPTNHQSESLHNYKPNQNSQNGEYVEINNREDDSVHESTSPNDENGDEVFTNVNVGHHFEYNINSNLSPRQKRLTIHQVQVQHEDLLNEYLMMGPPPPPPLQPKAQVFPLNYYDVVPTGREERVVGMSSTVEVTASANPTNNILMKKTSTLTTDRNEYILVQPPAANLANDSTQSSSSSPSYPPVVPNSVFGIGAQMKSSSTSVEVSASGAGPGTQPPAVLLDASDENLIELMTNFKDNVYNMQQLQLLFENWKSRSDVQNDMKERQKELKRIRDEYKKIQDSAKKTKKSSASLKFFPGKKKNSTAGLTHANTTIHHSQSSSKDGLAAENIPGQVIAAVNSNSTPQSPEVEKPAPVLVWKNPHDDRFFAPYVQPTASPNTSTQTLLPQTPPPSSTTMLPEPESPPPPRPAKKISTTMAPPSSVCPTPTVVPCVKKAPPPPPLSPTPKLSFVNYSRSSRKK